MAFPFSITFNTVECLRLFENEVRHILCPGKKMDEIEYKMKRLQNWTEITEKRLKELEEDEEKERIGEVQYWMESVDLHKKEVDQLKGELQANRRGPLSCLCCCCCSCSSNYRHGEKAELLLRQIDKLIEEREGWDSDEKLVKKRVQKHLMTTATHQNIITQSAMAENKGKETENQQLHGPWHMFCKQVEGGAADLQEPSIQQLAKAIVAECQNSQEGKQDLAIKAVGQTIKNYTLVGQWEETLHWLQNPPLPREITPKIEIILRFCYDSIGSQKLRSCLSYCILFRHNSMICENDLIVGWIGEGLLDDVNIDTAYEEGQQVISKLKATFMLESSNWCDFYLKINDNVRYMVLQSPYGVGGNHSLINWTGSDASAGDLQLWASMARISLKEEFIKSLPNRPEAFSEASLPDNTPTCPNLITLLLGGNKELKRIHNDFFRFIPTLRVLDLSNTRIEVVPKSVGLLLELRCFRLKETKIHTLPLELGKLRRLRILDLNETKNLTQVPREAILGLSMLQVLRMSNCAYRWDPAIVNEDGHHQQQPFGMPSLLTITDLRGLDRLQHLWITVISAEIFQLVLGLQYSMTITGLTLKGKHFTQQHLHLAFSSLHRLQWAELGGCTRVEELVIGRKQLLLLQELKLSGLGVSRIVPEENIGPQFLPNLRHVGIWGCLSLKDLTWLSQLAKLELVCVQNCKGVTELITRADTCSSNGISMATNNGNGGQDTDDEGSFFPNLQFLVLHSLPELRSFSWRHPLLLPSLRTLRIKHCPMLRRLPLGHNSCKDIKEIRGTTEWWNQLQWDHDEIKSRFFPHFQPY